jgi:hypothetical protein
MRSSRIGRLTRRLRRQPTLEVHIPISPTPTFFNMVRCLTLSLRRFGGTFRQAPVHLTIGDATIDPGLADRYPWLRELGIECHWVPEERFQRYSYAATGDRRFHHAYRSDVVLFLDADILVADEFDDLIYLVHDRQVFAGMIAPASPLQFFRSPTTWDDIYRHCGLKQTPRLEHEHTGWPYYYSGDLVYQYSPPYFNYGVVAAPARMMSQIGRTYFEHVLKLRELTDSDLVAQVALTIAITELGLPNQVLPVRYNFPNHPLLEALHGLELPRAKFLHLKENHQIQKEQLFSSMESIQTCLRRTDLRGINQIAQRVLRAIAPSL